MAICFEGLAECNTDSGHMLSRLDFFSVVLFLYGLYVHIVWKGHLVLFFQLIRIEAFTQSCKMRSRPAQWRRSSKDLLFRSYSMEFYEWNARNPVHLCLPQLPPNPHKFVSLSIAVAVSFWRAQPTTKIVGIHEWMTQFLASARRFYCLVSTTPNAPRRSFLAIHGDVSMRNSQTRWRA